MGPAIRRRIQQQSISREWTWASAQGYETEINRGTSCGVSDDTSSETLSDWERMDYGDDGSVDQT